MFGLHKKAISPSTGTILSLLTLGLMLGGCKKEAEAPNKSMEADNVAMPSSEAPPLEEAEAEEATAPASPSRRRRAKKVARAKQRDNSIVIESGESRLAMKGGGAQKSGAVYDEMLGSLPEPKPPADEKKSEGTTKQDIAHGINPFTKTSEDKLSTFAIDVDTGSYTVARRQIMDGRLPTPTSVRVEEFVNYFDYDYPNPDAGPFGVSLEIAPSPYPAKAERHLMRIGVQGRRIPTKNRKPVHLTFLVDVSGSMNSPDKLGLAKEALGVLVDNLKPDDTVAIVTYAGRTAVVLEPTKASNQGAIKSKLHDMTSGGGTAMGDGMELAYKLAIQQVQPGHVSRVLVLSDGDANIGLSSHEEILKSIKSYVDEGVTLSTIGFGMGNYRDSLMEQLANKGNGNYYYIDSIKEARKVFGEQADGTLEVIAKDVKIQVEFHPESVESYRLIGYENRDIADKDFRNDKVDAGEIGAGHSVTALYEVELQAKRDKSKPIATVRIRHKKPEEQKASEQTFLLTARDMKAKLADSSKSMQFAAAVAGFAEILRKSPHASKLTLGLVEELAKATLEGREERQEFLKLVQKAKTLNERRDRAPR